jgi:lipopolysaccharide transport system ATP-binding protein
MKSPTQVSDLGPQPSDDVLVRVENVSKKFCRSLKRSLWYGMKDLGSELIGSPHNDNGQLRKDEFWAVKDVSFELKRGECLGLIGRNGAGKTTLLRMLNGLIKPDKGRIEMHGRVGALIALGAGFNPILTGRENIYIKAAVLGRTKKEVDDSFEEIVEFAELGEFIDSPVQNYSSGMAVRLGFSIAVKTKPDILLLDEVLAVGDIKFQSKCFNAIAEFKKRGTAFMLVSHNIHHIRRHSDKILYLKRGSSAHFTSVNQGCKQYLIDIGDDNKEDNNTDWDNVCGTGKVTIDRAIFRDSSGKATTEITSGEKIFLEVEFTRVSDFTSPVILDMLIRDNEGVAFQGTNADSGEIFDNLPPKGIFVIEFSCFPINANSASFFLAVMDAHTKEIMDWKRHIKLLIRRNTAQIGRLKLPVKWKVKQCDNVYSRNSLPKISP